MKLHPASRALRGKLRVPGDKSISHRSIILGALAKGTTEVSGFLYGADCLATVDCFGKLGVRVEEARRKTDGRTVLHVEGRGIFALDRPQTVLDAKNSGTTARLLTGVLAAQAFESTITGDASLVRRPMKRVTEPLGTMGARIESVNGDDCLPLRIQGTRLNATDYRMRVASAQVKSAILLAALYAEAPTILHETVPSRDHTERMLAAFGAALAVEEEKKVSPVAHRITLTPGKLLRAQKIHIPADISSAAFLMAAALLVPESEVLLKEVGINPTRAGLLHVLEALGADVELTQVHDAMEPYADILVKHSLLVCPEGRLEIEGEIIPTLIDELPVIAVLAAFAEGETVIRDAAELRVKESDRIALLVQNLRAMGADAEETPDGMIIRGGRTLHGANIKTHGDHRIAMGFAVAALAAEGDTVLDDDACIAVSYPDFFKDLALLS
ncbi:MAG: 3-phosphoshikimate 1-carboxyvinyltransferase [Lachnospiraceae bacterium]|nr:3-phosphoshikimate 1-carboxyvinyltransferase [Lachnospiraceae bacterium]